MELSPLNDGEKLDFQGRHVWFRAEATPDERTKSKMTWDAFKCLEKTLPEEISTSLDAATNRGEVWLETTLVVQVDASLKLRINKALLNELMPGDQHFTEETWYRLYGG